MKRFLIFLIIFLGLILWSSSNLFSQKQTQIESGFKPDFLLRGRLNKELGVFIPIGNFKNSIKPCPTLSIYLGVQVSEKISIDIGTSIFIPIKPNTIEFKVNDSFITCKPLLSGNLGLWISKINEINKKYTLENRFGTGIGFLQTDIPTNKAKECNDTVEGSETIFLNVGTKLRRKINSRKDIGIAVNYFYTPYNLFKQNLKSNFGNQYITVGISYGIN